MTSLDIVQNKNISSITNLRSIFFHIFLIIYLLLSWNMVVKSSLTNSIPAKKWEGHVKLRIQLSNRAFCSENVSQIFCRNRKFVPCHLEWSQGKFSLVSALIRLRDVAVLFRPCQRTCCLRRRGMMDFFPRSNCCYPLCDRRHRRDVEFFS